MAEGRGLVMDSGHIGHWELLARHLVRAGIPCAGDGHELSIELVPYDTDADDCGVESECVIAACTARLEAAIRARPAEWVWVHERWKTKPAAAFRWPRLTLADGTWATDLEGGLYRPRNRPSMWHDYRVRLFFMCWFRLLPLS